MSDTALELVSVYSEPDVKKTLYELLRERAPLQNISYRSMHSYEAHYAFVDSQPCMRT